MKNILIFISLALFLSFSGANTGKIVVHIEPLKEFKGSVYIAMYDKKEHFLNSD